MHANSENVRQNWPITVRVPVRVDFAGGWSDVPDFASREGGAVANAAISPYVEGRARWDEDGLRLEYALDLPPDSHLGTSGAVEVAWLRLTYGLIGKGEPDPVELAEQAARLEHMEGEAGGKQDQYAAALGGFHLLRFGDPGKPAEVEPLDLPAKTVRALEERCVLCHSGVGSSSGGLHQEVWKRYRAGDREIAAAVRRMRDSALEARDALLSGDLDALANVLTENREESRRLDSRLFPERLDALFSVGERAGALGSKSCGAGGGGCLLFLTAAGAAGDVRAALQAQNIGLIPFSFAPPRAELTGRASSRYR